MTEKEKADTAIEVTKLLLSINNHNLISGSATLMEVCDTEAKIGEVIDKLFNCGNPVEIAGRIAVNDFVESVLENDGIMEALNDCK